MQKGSVQVHTPIVMSALYDLQRFYNYDLLYSAVAAKFYSALNEASEIRHAALYIQDAIVRIFSLWDYMHQLLRIWVHLDMASNRQVRELYVKRSQYSIDFVPRGSGIWDLQYTQREDKPVDVLAQEVRKKLKYVAAPKEFRRVLREKYEVAGRLQEFLEIRYNPLVRRLENHRNVAIHVSPVGASWELDDTSSFATLTGIWWNSSGPEYKQIAALLMENVSLAGRALETLYIMLRNDEFPNVLENAGKSYKLALIRGQCGHSLSVPESLIDISIQRGLPLICGKCGREEPTASAQIEEVAVASEPIYFHHMRKQLEDQAVWRQEHRGTGHSAS